MSEPTPPTPTPPLRRTALYEFHCRHGGHLVPFAGWEMPLYYTSILAEHRAVREGAGLFDVSHMGILTLDGGHAAELLGRRTTANVPTETPGQVRYTFGQIPQLLLAGDSGTLIPAVVDDPENDVGQHEHRKG